jgi:hypothetical protein
MPIHGSATARPAVFLPDIPDLSPDILPTCQIAPPNWHANFQKVPLLGVPYGNVGSARTRAADWRSLRPRVNSRSEIRRKTGPRVDSKIREKSPLRGIFDLEPKTQSLILKMDFAPLGESELQ